MQNDRPLVSIVTPVHNGEKYLAECIESVLKQTYSNWEYIINENGSTDRTLDIAESYARREPRIRVARNREFVRALANHNIAIRQISAESRYCKVLQADDWLFPECLSRKVDIAVEHPSVGLVCSYRLQGESVDCDGLSYTTTFLPGREMGRRLLLGGPMVVGTMSHMLLRSDLVRARQSFFEESHLFADRIACFDVLQESDFGFIHQVLTYCRIHPEQLTTFVRRNDVSLACDLYCVRRFGRLFLDEREYSDREKELLDSYYAALGRSVIRMRERAYWDYHRGLMRQLDIPFSRFGVAGGAVRNVLGHLLEPARVGARQLRFLGPRFGRRGEPPNGSDA